jgi:predicted small lipoprotein YifL
MLRALVFAVVLSTAYCGAKGPPHPPIAEAADAGEPGGASDAGTP